MGTINWSDGTSTKMSSGTEKALQKKFKPKPTYRVGDVFWRDMRWRGNHYFQLRKEEQNVGLYDFRENTNSVSMSDLVCVKDIYAITLDEVQRMTIYPKGLRHVPNRNLVIIEK